MTGVAGSLLLQACLFETRTPRTVPLRLDESFGSYDPLVVTFLDRQGNIKDTLYAGPGRMDGGWTRSLAVEGLEDSGLVRLEGYASGRLAYRLDLPWPEDTLIALPRWTQVGDTVYSSEFNTASLGFRNGRPLVNLAYFGDYLAEFDGSAWTWLDLPQAPRLEGDLGARHYEVYSDSTGNWLFHTGFSLTGWRVVGKAWSLVLNDLDSLDGRPGDQTLAYSDGALVVADRGSDYPIHSVRVRHFAASAGWRASGERTFNNYRAPAREINYPPGTRHNFLAYRKGLTALLLVDESVDPYRMKLFRHHDGAWDSTASFPFVWRPALAVGEDGIYMAFIENLPDSTRPPQIGPVSLRRLGENGWEDVGARNIFGDDAFYPMLRIHLGVPFVASRTMNKGFQVARLRGNTWELLVQPRFWNYGQVLDFELDPAGIPYLATSGPGIGTRIVKFEDPRLP